MCAGRRGDHLKPGGTSGVTQKERKGFQDPWRAGQREPALHSASLVTHNQSHKGQTRGQRTPPFSPWAPAFTHSRSTGGLQARGPQMPGGLRGRAWVAVQGLGGCAGPCKGGRGSPAPPHLSAFPEKLGDRFLGVFSCVQRSASVLRKTPY